MGCLTLVLGPMFAAKSTELINIHTKLVAANKRVLAIKHAFDTRYDEKALTTHSRLKIFALRSTHLADFVDKFSAYDALLIDEGQFFVDIVPVVKVALEKGLYVYISALSGNFKREPFEVVSQLFPLASAIYLRSAICAVCHAPAPFSARFSDQTEEIVIGGAELYAPTCRTCWQAIAHRRSVLQAKQLTDDEIRSFVAGITAAMEGDGGAVLARKTFAGSKLLFIPMVTSPFDAELQEVYTTLAGMAKDDSTSYANRLLVITASDSLELDKAAEAFKFALRRFNSLVKSEESCTLADDVAAAVADESIILVYHADLYPHASAVLDKLVFQGKIIVAATSRNISHELLGNFVSRADVVSFSGLAHSADNGTGGSDKVAGASGNAATSNAPRFFRTCLTGLPLEGFTLDLCNDV